MRDGRVTRRLSGVRSDTVTLPAARVPAAGADRQLELIPGGARDRRARQTIRRREEIGNGKGVNICQITTK